VTELLSALTKTLKMRFGGKAFSDKHRIEIRNRRRKPDETLQSLHVDTRRLAALAFPSTEHLIHEVIASDYFLHSLADPEFALKIPERHPEDLDSALRIALQLEVWTKDSARLRQNEEYEAKKTRELTGPKMTSQERINGALRNEVDEQRKKIAELEQQLAKKPAPRPLVEATNNQTINCWKCGEAGHTIGDCPTKPRSNEDRTRIYEARKEQPKDVRAIRQKHHISALLDTGSDIFIAGNEVAKKYNWQIHPHPIKTVKVANDEDMIIYGAARIPLRGLRNSHFA